MGFLIVLCILIGIYALLFKAAGGIIRGIYRFFHQLLEDALRGHQFQASGAMLGGFLLTVGVIALIIALW